jgi:tRNA 2-selenouridine synthase
MPRVNSKNYKKIFLSGAPLVDLRAPGEYLQGAFPSSVSLPLMSDEERRLVGTCYKQKGQDEAIALGYQLVSGETKVSRVAKWLTFAKANQQTGYFYCFRGGLRSKISQQWLAEAGLHLPIIEGGYKAMRQFLIQETEHLIRKKQIYIIAGLTGSAKTKFIVNQASSIDLEGLANHRGSSFGRHISTQPSQIDFENRLAIKLLKHQDMGFPFLLLEDESRLIGSRSIPIVMKQKMDLSPLLMIEESFDYRVKQIFEDYVILMMEEFRHFDRDNAISLYQKYLVESTTKIKKRLGGVALKEMLLLIDKAIERQLNNKDLSLHQDWIAYLLNNYYDPMYKYQMAKKATRIQFKGSTEELSDYILNMT